MQELMKYHTGGGCMALRITDKAHPKLFMYVTDSSYSAIPDDPENEILVFGVYPDDDDAHDEHLLLRELTGRQGMIDMLQNKGHDLPAATAPINDVILATASAMMQEASNELKQKSSRQNRRK